MLHYAIVLNDCLVIILVIQLNFLHLVKIFSLSEKILSRLKGFWNKCITFARCDTNMLNCISKHAMTKFDVEIFVFSVISPEKTHSEARFFAMNHLSILCFSIFLGVYKEKLVRCIL